MGERRGRRRVFRKASSEGSLVLERVHRRVGIGDAGGGW